MKNREIYEDYQNVYKAISGDVEARKKIEANYGSINNMGDLYALGNKLFDLLSQHEKKMNLTQTILSLNSIEYLHKLLFEIKAYMTDRLKLTIKGNYQIFPVDARGIDFVGYVFRHTHTRLRKSIKQSFARMIAKGGNPQSVASYRGWAKHCNSKNLIKKLFKEKMQYV